MNTPVRFRLPKNILPMGLAAFAAAVLPASAASVSWDGGAAGTGTSWNLGTNWNPDTGIGSANDLTIATRTGGGTMPNQTIDGNFTSIRSLSFDNTSGQYPGGGLIVSSNNTSSTRTLTFTTGNITNLTVAANTDVTLSRTTGGTFNIALVGSANNTWDIGAGSSLTLGPISGNSTQTGPVITGNATTSALTKTGAGILYMGNSNTFGGGLNINAGTVAINGSPAQLGPSAATAIVTINGGTLRVINATAQSGSGRTFNIGSSEGTIEVDSGKVIGIAGNFTNVPSQTGVLRKTGDGLLSMEMGSSQQTISGGTIVEQGTLRIVNNMNYGASGGVGVTVQDGGILQGGTTNDLSQTVIKGNSVMEQNSRLDLGVWGATGGSQTSTTAFMRIDGNLDISGAATSSTPAFLWDLKTTTTSDKLTLSSTFVLTIGSGVLGFSDFTFTPGVGFAVGTYTLFSTTENIVGTLVTPTFQPIDSLFGKVQLSSDLKSIELVVSAVPEPSTYALVGLGALVGLMAWRKNRRRASI